jgi:hypothetical protein
MVVATTLNTLILDSFAHYLVVQVHGEKKQMQDGSFYLVMHQLKIPTFLIRSFN